MRVRYVVAGHMIRSSTLIGVTEAFGMTEKQRREVLAAVSRTDGIWEGIVNGRRAWVWECPRIEFVSPQGPDGEPDMDFVYVDGPLAERYRSRGTETSEPEFVRTWFRRGALPPDVAAA